MTTKDNYFKIVVLIVETACSVIWNYMKQNILGSSSFESFLNLKEVKHKLVHVYEKRECCECGSDKIIGERLIAKQQLLVLYETDETKRIQSHKEYSHGKVIKVCICNYHAKQNIDIEVLDITLANYIIKRCGKGEKGLNTWMTQIKDLRNEIFHLSDIKELKDDEFKNKWKIIEGSILGIANLIDKEYAEETKLMIIRTNQLTFIPAYMFNYEILCRDYWKTKCAEFERTQCNEIEQKANALHTKLPGVFTGSMKKEWQTTMKEIHNFQMFVDKINILTKVFGNQETLEVFKDAESLGEDWQSFQVPAFLQLDVPTSWNETKIWEYLQDMRLSGTSDSNIKIIAVSREDLNIYTTMDRAVIGNVNSLKREIKTLLSGMLSEVAIDTTQGADISVNVTIPGNSTAETLCDETLTTIYDKVLVELHRKQTIREKSRHSHFSEEQSSMKYEPKEKNIEMNREDVVERQENRSDVQDGKARTTADVVEKNIEMNREDVVERQENRSDVQDGKARTTADVVEKNIEMNREDVVERQENCSDVQDGKARTTADVVEIGEMNREDVVEKTKQASSGHNINLRTQAEFIDMVSTEKTNYCKLVALLVDTASHVIWTYIRKQILGSTSFESFLNIIEEKHKLIHVYETNACCECVFELINGSKLISRKQLLLLYKSDVSKQIKNHAKYIDGKVVRVCTCKYVAIKDIDVKKIDITLASHIILKCGKQELGLDSWITQIKEVRNEIFHISDMQRVSDNKFNRKWEKVKGSILGIAQLINSEFAEITTKKIQQTKTITCIPDYMLKYEILCRDYWRNKCAEFERTQIENFLNKEEALHIHSPKVCSTSIGRDSQKTMEKIQNLNTIVENINILIKVFGNEQDMNTLKDTESRKQDYQRVHVPVFMQLDLPASWNRTTVLEYLDELRLNRTSDMNIRIMSVSPDDLKVFSEIARNVLGKVDLLKQEVNRIISGMLVDVASDMKHIDDVVVSLTIPEFTESIPLQLSFQLDVQLRKKFELQSIRDFGNRDCLITNDLLVFTDHVRNRLLIYNFNGSYIRNIRLFGTPVSILVTNQIDVAVSYNQEFIDIISIKTGKVKNIIKTSGIIGGISYQNGLMYVVINYQTVDVIDLTGKIIRSLSLSLYRPDNMLESTVGCLSTDTDSLFLTYPLNNTLYCCDFNGSDRWTFTDDKMIQPSGITTDQNGNVYVSCYKSNNVIVVSSEGKHHKELLNKKDRLHNPTGIYYNKSNDCLLVCNEGNCNAFLFDVKHSAKNE
ncbi:uncharacterized protein [Mytilus edulis]|uniref:uncharacterized protein isoform X2 n=1 Tax=Mytilus edulis TaxID=6550 RepID=UPI0039EF12BA